MYKQLCKTSILNLTLNILFFNWLLSQFESGCFGLTFPCLIRYNKRINRQTQQDWYEWPYAVILKLYDDHGFFNSNFCKCRHVNDHKGLLVGCSYQDGGELSSVWDHHWKGEYTNQRLDNFRTLIEMIAFLLLLIEGSARAQYLR